MKTWLRPMTGAAKGALWLTIAAGSLLIIQSSYVYLVPGAAHPFLIEKLPISRDLAWRVNLRVHVAAGLICLPAVLGLFSRTLLRRLPGVHRILGRLYAIAVLGLLVPTGFYLALFAKGGIVGTLGFSLSGAIAAAATWMGVRQAIRGHLGAHRAWMIRSAAQITSAITFRLFHLILEPTGLEYMTTYLIALWLSTLVNAAVAELIIAGPRLWRIRHELMEKALFAGRRVRSAGRNVGRGSGGVVIR